ncbi:MAG: hypothetical protein WB821_01495 [Burkholderiaceae bacterium]
MSWISKLFSKSNGVELPSNSTGFQDMEAAPKPIRLQGTDLRAARETIHSTAMKTAKACGVPPLWLTFEVITMADSEKAYFQLQVVIQHWDEYLAAHSYAFERAVMKRLMADNKRVGRAVRAILWRTAYDAGCPYEDMPDPGSWTTEAIKKRAAAQTQTEQLLRTPEAVTQPPAPQAGEQNKPVQSKDKFAGLLDDEQFARSRDFDDAFAKTQPYGKGDGFAATEPMGLGGDLPPR